MTYSYPSSLNVGNFLSIKITQTIINGELANLDHRVTISIAKGASSEVIDIRLSLHEDHQITYSIDGISQGPFLHMRSAW